MSKRRKKQIKTNSTKEIPYCYFDLHLPGHNKVDYLLKCLFIICIFFSKKCLFISLTYLCIRCLLFLLLMCRRSLHIKSINTSKKKKKSIGVVTVENLHMFFECNIWIWDRTSINNLITKNIAFFHIFSFKNQKVGTKSILISLSII